MNQNEYERAMDAIANVEAKVAAFHKAATGALTAAQKAVDTAAAAFLDAAEGAREQATKTRSGDVWNDTTDSTKSNDSASVERQIADVVNRLKREYESTTRGGTDSDPLKTVTNLVNEIFNSAGKRKAQNGDTDV